MEICDGATPIDPDEAAGLLDKGIKTQGQLNTAEQANVALGLLWLEESASKLDWTDDFLRELHRKLFGQVWDWAGTYRKTERNIGIAPREISVEVRKLVEDSRFWAENDVYEPLEAAARLHFRMVHIHPFPNGNGRHGRIATDFFLQRLFGHKEIDWAQGSDLQMDARRRDAYLQALRAADRNDFDPLFAFVGFPGRDSAMHIETRPPTVDCKPQVWKRAACPPRGSRRS